MNAIHARSQLRYWPTLPQGSLQLYPMYPIPEAPGRGQVEGAAARACARVSHSLSPCAASTGVRP